jgi:ATP-dependent exoDNAse (exonuclease V) beta subunit
VTRPPSDQAVRDRVVRDFDTTFLLEAGAGTGKTTVLVARIVELLRSGRTGIDRIAAITFTDKAAGELKLRLREELERLAATSADARERERLREAAAGLDRAVVSTIHSFALALLKERPFEARLDPEFGVAADVVGDRSFDDAWSDWIDARLAAGDPAFVDGLHLGVSLDDLRSAARQVVAERDVLGQPVTGVGLVDPAPLRKRVQETARRLGSLKPHCFEETDGALAAIEALEEFADRSRRAEGAALRSQLLALKITYNKGTQKNWDSKDVLKLVKEELKALRDERDAFERAVTEGVAVNLRNQLAAFLEFFQSRQRERALLDFQGLLLEARDMLARDAAVRRYFQQRFDALLIDEFQDTDPLQVEIAFFLAEKQGSAPATSWAEVRLEPGKLFLVGDPKQSIYRFRRADLAVYEKAKARILDCGGEVLPLTSNFRTVPSIVDFVNERFTEVFRTDPQNDPQPIPLKAERAEVHRGGARVVALPIPPEALPADPAEDKVDALRPLIANAIAGFVGEVTRERPWSVREGDAVRQARPGDIGLLVRALTGVEHIESALRARGIGYRLVGGKAYHQRGEVADLRGVLLAIDNAADRLALVQALRSPFFGLSDADLARFVAQGGILSYNAPVPDALAGHPVSLALDLLRGLHRKRRIDPPSAVVRALFERTRALPGYLLSHEGVQSVANLWKVAEIAQAYEAAGPATLRGFVRFLEDQSREAREEGDSPVGDEAGQNVEILTVHRAKGLEYPIVVVADILSKPSSRDTAFIDHAAGQGWLKIGKLEPPGFAQQKEVEKARAAAEERRLLYVALTRARDHLVLPVLPLERKKAWGSGWTAPALQAIAPAGEPAYGQVSAARTGGDAPGRSSATVLDSRAYFPPPPAEPGPRPADALEGGDAELAAAREQEEAWSQARKARRLAARAAATPAAAVTEVVKEGQEREPDDAAAVAFGRLVHALLARASLDGDGLAALAAALAPDLGLDAARASAAASVVAEALRLPVFDRVRASKRVLRETPVTATLDGQRVSGVMDLAFLEDGGWTVLEYKTGGAGRGRAAGEQLRLYGRALQAATGQPVMTQVVVIHP